MPPPSLRDGYIKATPENLPKIDVFMQACYLNSASFLKPEIRNVKTLRSGRENYGDDAIGWVQLKRTGDECEIYAQITPEHNVKLPKYSIYCKVDEKQDNILTAKCLDCVAHEDGCKHAVAFVAYLERKTRQKSVTSTTSYWEAPRLSRIGSTLRFKKIDEIVSQAKFRLSNEEKTTIRNESLESLRKVALNIAFVHMFLKEETYFLDHLMIDFKKNFRKPQHSAANFLSYCILNMKESKCKELAEKTKRQANSTFWYNLRFGRITASKLYEASRCETPDGSLVSTILGATKVKLSAAMERGQRLESQVLQKTKEKYALKNIKKTGLVIDPVEPMFGASPDGLTDKYIIEIKCPSNPTSFLTYFNKQFTEPANKYKAQMFLQMRVCRRRKGLFCVAHHDFETSGQVTWLEVDYESKFINEIMGKAQSFWQKHIYQTIYDGF